MTFILTLSLLIFAVGGTFESFMIFFTLETLPTDLVMPSILPSFPSPSDSPGIIKVLVNMHYFILLQRAYMSNLRPCAQESGSVRLRSHTGTDRPTVHTGSSLSVPVWLRYPYQRGTDKKNGAVWLRSIWLPCEPTDRIRKKVQIGNEANFVYKRGLSTSFVF